MDMKDITFNQAEQIELWAHEKANNDLCVSFRIKETLFSASSAYQRVQIVDTAGYGKMLFNDGIAMLAERDEFIYHEMIAHVPLFIHPDPKNILVIGGGDGGTVREVLKHPSVTKCTLCEIDELVISACKKHIPQTAACLCHDDPRVDIQIKDAVEFIKKTGELYDVIIVDSSDPIGPAAPLFGAAFYADVYAHLTERGLVVAQAESPFIYQDEQKCLLEIIKKQCGRVCIYNFTTLTYPGGLWSFALSGKGDFVPGGVCDEKRLRTLEGELQYYTAQMHTAAFSLPVFQQKNLAGLIDPCPVE
jgi:spermidine synthase